MTTTSLTTITTQDLERVFLRGRKPATITAYKEDLALFARWRGEQPTLIACTQGQANKVAWEYRGYLIETGASPSTVNRRLTTLRSLVKMARTLGIVAWELEVPGVKSEQYRDTRGAGVEVVKGAIQSANVRDRAILRMMFDMGLRRGEVTALDVEHIVDGAAMVLGKGKRERVAITMPKATLAAVGEWLREHPTKTGALFISKSGRRMTGGVLWEIVRRYGMHPHGVRHTAITAALDVTGGDVRKVRAFSRHASVQTVVRYDDNRTDMAGLVSEMVAGGVP